MSIEIESTDDVAQTILLALVSELPEEFKPKQAPYKIVLRAAEPPSWFTLIAEMDWWLKILGGYAAVYLAAIANVAGKETWEKRADLVPGLAKTAKAIIGALKRGRQNTKAAELAVPQPESTYTAKLTITGVNEEEVAMEVALFVHHLPSVISTLKSNLGEGNAVVDWVSLEILPDGALQMHWMDRESLEVVTVVLQV